jgi:hypothetical protein
MEPLDFGLSQGVLPLGFDCFTMMLVHLIR